jgi:hypothetical protein
MVDCLEGIVSTRTLSVYSWECRSYIKVIRCVGCRFMVRDKEGAMEDLREHALALKRKELQVSLTVLQS